MKQRNYFTRFPLLLAGFLCLAPTLLSGQSAIAYDYDHAGNRIARRVIHITPRAVPEKTIANPDSVIEVLSDMEIHAYPNPARETLHVDAKHLRQDTSLQITLFNIQGAIVFRKETLTPSNIIDMSVYPSGVYILRVSSADKDTEIKIIKQ